MTGEEIWKQTNGQINYFVSPIGTSGTVMGVGKYLKEHNPQVKVVCAHPVKGHYIQGLKNMEEAIVPSIYDPSQIDITIMVKTEDLVISILKLGLFAALAIYALELLVRALLCGL